jgi:hypothetical protein
VSLVAERTGVTGQRGRRARRLRRTLAAFAVGGAAVGWRAGDPGVPSTTRVGLTVGALRRQWFELALAVAACCAVVAAQLITAGISRLSGFVLRPCHALSGDFAPQRH